LSVGLYVYMIVWLCFVCCEFVCCVFVVCSCVRLFVCLRVCLYVSALVSRCVRVLNGTRLSVCIAVCVVRLAWCAHGRKCMLLL
jgi:hypothetical protein